MVVECSQQETLEPDFVLLGTRQQSVPVILRELVLPGGSYLVSPSFTEEAMEVDKTHIEESTQLHHKASPHLGSSRPKEKRTIKEHIMMRNGNRQEKNEQQSDRTRKECPGLGGLENAGRRPMLCLE
ncbi:unnamed protein product [Schistosoma curassoni]|uniref:tRNA (adenine(58)-N(1))-methyltransferase n=1 Tax=Schistosoma curassoni TaxID=6186 RepID=A0A183JZI9_9TREM|nr:unnamed protein product [Schistosoma curassoni]